MKNGASGVGGKFNRAEAYWGAGAKILNWMPCDKGEGTAVSVNRFGGASVADASLEWITEGAMTGARFKTNVGTDTAIAGGSWQIPEAGSDLLILILKRDVDVGAGPLYVSNWQFGGASPNCNIHMGGGGTIGPFGLETNAGEPFLPNVKHGSGIVTRAGLALENGVQWSGSNAPAGTDLVFAGQTNEVVGELDDTFTDTYQMSLVNRYFDLFAMVWVEFPTGLPAGFEAKANEIFALWESGTKDYVA